MKTASTGTMVTLPPALLAEVEAAAKNEQRPVADVLRDMIEEGLEHRRSRAEVLALVDQAETSLAQGGGTVITQDSMRQLAADVKQRGRARLAAEINQPR